jgi:hypothetical protein
MSDHCAYIHEDRGEKNEKETLWYSLDGSRTKIYPFIVLLKRPMGCQYINPQNSSFLNVFNFNINIQIGNVSQVFYSTLYTSNSTSEEDSEKQLLIGHAVIKRIKRLLDEIGYQTIQPNNINHEHKFMGQTSNDECNQARLELNFHEGLSRIHSGLNAAMGVVHA